jgi:hypothetical protein
MNIIVNIIALVALIIIIIILAVLLIPLKMRLQGRYDRTFEGSAVLSWLWGFARCEYALDQRTITFRFGEIFRISLSKTSHDRSPRIRQREHQNKTRKPRVPRFLKNPAMVWRLGTRTIHSLQVHGALHLRFGCSDPALTGIIYGVLALCTQGLIVRSGITPDFSRAMLTGNGMITFRIWLIDLLYIFISTIVKGG